MKQWDKWWTNHFLHCMSDTHKWTRCWLLWCEYYWMQIIHHFTKTYISMLSEILSWYHHHMNNIIFLILRIGQHRKHRSMDTSSNFTSVIFTPAFHENNVDKTMMDLFLDMSSQMQAMEEYVANTVSIHQQGIRARSRREAVYTLTQMPPQRPWWHPSCSWQRGQQQHHCPKGYWWARPRDGQKEAC